MKKVIEREDSLESYVKDLVPEEQLEVSKSWVFTLNWFKCYVYSQSLQREPISAFELSYLFKHYLIRYKPKTPSESFLGFL